MQIRYKITFIYATTAAIILLLLCISIYYFSAQDRIVRFRESLKVRALNTYQLLHMETMDSVSVREVSRLPSAILSQKTIHIYNNAHQLIFTDRDANAPVLVVPHKILKKTQKGADVYFRNGLRDALAFKTHKNIIVIAGYDVDRVVWLSKLKTILTASFFLSIALVMMVGYIFSLRLVHAISKISCNLKDISTKDLSLRLVSEHNRDELHELVTNINNLLIRLQESFETQGRFIDNASHELSTPLAVILTQLDIARQKIRSREEYEVLVDSVYEDVSRLNTLVKSLLDLAKVSGSLRGLELSRFRVDDMLMQLPLNMKKINPRYKVKLLFDEFPDNENAMLVYGNEALLLCALHNIAHNACKYTPDHAAIVKLNFSGDIICISVQDFGPGIDREDLDRIFQPFHRGVNVDTAISGNGIGLSLAQNIIKLHNGSIFVETGQGTGTTFIIKINSFENHSEQLKPSKLFDEK